MKSRRFLLLLFIFALLAVRLFAQTLRYSNHRTLEIPPWATLHIGPFFSDISFRQTAGYRYIRSSGTGVDFLRENNRGIYEKDGYDFPLISRLDFRNYFLISQRMDMDLSLSVNYEHYPRGTQKDSFFIAIPEEGLIGDLSFMFQPVPFMKNTLYDNFVYRTDYIDTRGIPDLYGGSEYEYFKNTAGVNSDWLIADDQNVGFSFSRTDNLPMDDMFSNQEYITYSETVLYERRFIPFLSAGIKASFSQVDYEITNRIDSSAGEYLLYTQVQLTERTSAGAGIGYSDVFSGLEDNSGGRIVGNAYLKTQLSQDMLHSLVYNHSRERGFLSNYEMTDVYSYELQKKFVEGFISIKLSHGKYDPNSDLLNGYNNSHIGFDFSFPLIISLLKINGGISYDMRENSVANEAMREIENIADYDTLVSYLGTGTKVMKNLDFTILYKHVERNSDDFRLEYKTDIFSADFIYRCAF